MTATPGDTRHDHLIVGGGVAGCSLAHELARRARRVVLLESGRIGAQGASSVPVALLNPYRGRSARASRLDLAGLAATARLAAELEGLGLEPGVRFTGVLRIASNEKQAAAWRRRPGLRRLEPGEVHPSYHAPFGAFLAEGGGWLEPRAFLAALAAAARRRGATLVEGCPVERLEPEGAGFVVHTSKGPYRADSVIVCTGAAPAAGLGVPALERVDGDVVGLASDVALPYPLAGAVYGARLRACVYIGGNHRPAGRPDPEAAARLQGAASWFVKALGDARRESVWTGTRAKTSDNAPLVTELRPGVWFLGALAGRGFLCSARLAADLAERLTGQAGR